MTYTGGLFEPMTICWKKPVGNCVKLNVDGAVNWHSGRGGFGCVAIDGEGKWMPGEARRLGHVRPLTGNYVQFITD